MSAANVEQKLGIDIFEVDEQNAHIVLVDSPNMAEFDKLVIACPAGLYKHTENGIRFDYAGCLECGACRVLCGNTIVQKWEYPRGSQGVEFRYG